MTRKNGRKGHTQGNVNQRIEGLISIWEEEARRLERMLKRQSSRGYTRRRLSTVNWFIRDLRSLLEE